MFTSTFLFIFEITLAATQIPSHTDYQKIGEVLFRNEKYNVYKPTIHSVTDYFKSYMLDQLRRKPNERVFIDDDGFRHEWLNFDEDKGNLRKQNTDISVKNETTTRPNAEKKRRKTPKRKKKVTEAVKEDRKNLREGENLEGRTVAKTTFYCPFLGIVTMHSFLD
ncbi:uncharacterized protein LOC134201237 [Bombyx mori]|uniref:uncharacterized protein LOC134201237 n=1 Tax=Bombyx mori TaxID=7091 RepID=UPI000B3CA3D0